VRWLLLAVGAIWALLAPPLFTDGACTREFEAEAARIEKDRDSLGSLAAARAYWNGRNVEHRVLSLEQCRRARLRFLDQCGPGPMVYATVPVANLICRIYRDTDIKVQLHYTERDRLARVHVDMAPFRSLPIPGTGARIDWAK
jgi:hypothetical protein